MVRRNARFKLFVVALSQLSTPIVSSPAACPLDMNALFRTASLRFCILAICTPNDIRRVELSCLRCRLPACMSVIMYRSSGTYEACHDIACQTSGQHAAPVVHDPNRCRLSRHPWHHVDQHGRVKVCRDSTATTLCTYCTYVFWRALDSQCADGHSLFLRPSRGRTRLCCDRPTVPYPLARSPSLCHRQYNRPQPVCVPYNIEWLFHNSATFS